jgi:hypothetical protein
MMAWEAKLFKAGAGCPSCEGTPPEGETDADADARSIRSAETMADAWDDPDSFPHVLDTFASAVGAPMPKRAEWKEPAREVVWTCEGCKAQAVKPLAFSLCEPNKGSNAWLEWANGERVHYSHGIAFARGDSLDSELHHDPDANNGRGGTVRCSVAHDLDEAHRVNGKPYCDKCAGMCQAPSCTTVVFLRSDLDPGDPYAPGASFCSTGNVGDYGDTLCVECHERDSEGEQDHDSKCRHCGKPDESGECGCADE